MISKSATDPNTCTTGASFTKSARSAWGHIIRCLSSERPQTVLLPAYIGFTEREGSGVFDPVAENCSKYLFYKVRDDLSVDLEDIRARIVENVSIVLVIHYFGFCRSDMAAIRQICNEANAVLVEDCAHAFQLESPTPSLGRLGDFAFYSLHKHIATSSGGILTANGKHAQLPPIREEDIAAHEVVEQYARTNFEAIRKIRRANYSLYEELLAPLAQIDILFSLRTDDIPQTFPIRVKEGKREALYFYLMERGVPTTALYYRMIDEISSENFPTSLQIASEILNLPVHQDTTIDDVRVVCANIMTFFSAPAV